MIILRTVLYVAERLCCGPTSPLLKDGLSRLTEMASRCPVAPAAMQK